MKTKPHGVTTYSNGKPVSVKNVAVLSLPAATPEMLHVAAKSPAAACFCATSAAYADSGQLRPGPESHCGTAAEFGCQLRDSFRGGGKGERDMWTYGTRRR